VSKSPGLLFALFRQSVLCSSLLFLLLTPALGQSEAALADPTQHRDLYNLEHYVHVVPKTPADYHPITADARLGWFARATVGPKSLIGGAFSSAIGTALDSPHEYGPHWDGFAQRYGMRLTGISTSNAMEAGLGAIWGEDPRYFHTVHDPFGTRVKNILDLTVRDYGRDGQRHFAYARFIAIIGSNFLSNTWRVQSEADTQHALVRSAEGFGGRALSNAFSELVPLVWRKVRHKPDPFPADLTSP
jgi:hypothetical protein